MAPKAQVKPPAGRGRPKRVVASEAAPVADGTPARRGRPAKTAAAVELPKKRGRPAKEKEEEPVAHVETAPAKRGRRSLVAPEPEPEPEPQPKKSRGRPKKEVEAVEEAPAPTKTAGRGRPGKQDIAVAATHATPKRGRPAKTKSLNLKGVAGSPRVTKRSSPRTSKTRPSKAAVTVTPRMDPRVRSKLRTRLPPAKKVVKEQPVAQPSKRGRPRKAVAEAPTPKKTLGRKPRKTASAAAKPSKAAVVKPAKATAPRKRRGFTTLEIPDKFAAAVQTFYEDLVNGQAEEPASGSGSGSGSASASADEDDVELEELMNDVVEEIPQSTSPTHDSASPSDSSHASDPQLEQADEATSQTAAELELEYDITQFDEHGDDLGLGLAQHDQHSQQEDEEEYQQDNQDLAASFIPNNTNPIPFYEQEATSATATLDHIFDNDMHNTNEGPPLAAPSSSATPLRYAGTTTTTAFT